MTLPTPHPAPEASRAGLVGDLAVASFRASSRAELFAEFAEAIGATLGPDFAEVLEYLRQEDALVLRDSCGLPGDLKDRARVPAGLLSQEGRALLDPLGGPVELEDISRPHDWADSELVVEHGAKSGMAVRVEEDGRPVAVLGAFYKAPRRFSPDERRFMARAARMLGAGLHRLRREREAASWHSRSELLRAGAALLKVPAERDDILFAAAVAGVAEGPSGARPMADWCAADALEAGGRLPKLRRAGVAHAGGGSAGLREAFSVPLSPSAPHGTARAYLTRQPELVRRCDEAFVDAISRDPGHRRAVEEARPSSYLCVPVVGHDRFYGAIGFMRTQVGNPTPFDDQDLLACSEFAGLVAAAIERGMPRTDIAEAQEAVRSHIAPKAPGLSEREREVLAGIAAGQRLNQIGPQHNISVSTVRGHKRTLCFKLGLKPEDPDTLILAEARRRGVPGLAD